MTTPQKPRRDLGERTADFSDRVRRWVRRLERSYLTEDDIKQLIRSSGSVAANYVEANEAISKKTCGVSLKTCRKEAKESEVWLKALAIATPHEAEQERIALLQEAGELKRIFNAIIEKYYT